MTAQAVVFVVAFVVIALLVTRGVLADTARAVARATARDRARGGRFLDLANDRGWRRSRLVPYGEVHVFDSRTIGRDRERDEAAEWRRWMQMTPDERDYQTRLTYMREARLAVTIQRPESFVTVTA